jgi:hypothetical protein
MTLAHPSGVGSTALRPLRMHASGPSRSDTIIHHPSEVQMRFLITCCAAVLLLAACSTEQGPSESVGPNSAQTSLQKVAVPLSGMLTGTTHTVSYSIYDPTHLLLNRTISTAGDVSHLGATVNTATFQIIWPMNNMAVNAHVWGTGTLLAANGDQLTMNVDGYANMNLTTMSNDLTSTWTVTGGTGRFANATGSGAMTGAEDVSAGLGSDHPIVLVLNGTIMR